MNDHDKRRLNQIAKTLDKARKQIIEARLYISMHDNVDHEILTLNDVQDHVLIALARLGVEVE